MIEYEDIGQGEALLFIHGLGTQKQLWNAQRQLSKKFRLIIVELRGHGKSEQLTDLNVETYAKDIFEVLDYLEIQKVHICGLSLGGLIAQEMYRQDKARVHSLILCNTTFYIPQMVGEMSYQSTKEMIAQLGYEKFQETSIQMCLYDYTNERSLKLANEAFNIRKDTYVQSIQAAVGRNYLMDLLSCTSLLIIGAQEDQVMPVQNSIVFNQLIPTSKLTIIKNAGHLCNIEKTTEFNAIIEQHVNSKLSTT